MKESLLSSVAQVLGLPIETIVEWANNAPGSYKRYEVPKRSGGTRVILHPSVPTKALQYALISIIEPKARIHAAAMAYRRGVKSPLLKNALIHSQNEYLMRIDIKDFFPSIDPQLVIPKMPFEIIEHDFSFFGLSCFVKKNERGEWGLPIGAPSSPLLSNIAFFDIDSDLDQAAKELGGSYTRYADDLVFSCSDGSIRTAWFDFVTQALQSHSEGKLQINSGKTRNGSRAGRRSVTGVIITPQGTPSIGRARKRDLRVKLHKAVSGQLLPEEIEHARGLLAFASDIEPLFVKSMIRKYGDKILDLRRGKEIPSSVLPKLDPGD